MSENGPSHNPWFEHFTVGEQWHSHDDAFYHALQKRFARGAYWFWLFNDTTPVNAPRFCITIGHMSMRHAHNGHPIRSTKVKDGKFCGSGMIWAYDGKNMEELFVGMMDVEIDGDHKQVHMVTDGGKYRVAINGVMPDYEFRIFERKGTDRTGPTGEVDGNSNSDGASYLECAPDETLIGQFRTIGTGFSNGFEQNPQLKIRSFEGYSDGGDTFAKLDRCSQFPACASNVCDIFAPFEGEFRGIKMKGNTYTERAQSFGIVANWKISHVTFDDGSRFWLRYFTGKINYHDPLSFFMVHSTTGKRYAFENLRHVYYNDRGDGESGGSESEGSEGNGSDGSGNRAEDDRSETFRPEDTHILVEGSGPNGDLRVVFKITGHYLSRYQRMRYEARYYQFIMDVEEFSISNDGKILLSLDDFKGYTGYGEEAYKLSYRDTIRDKQIIRVENGAHTTV